MTGIRAPGAVIERWLALARQKQKTFIGGSVVTVGLSGATTVFSAITAILVARTLGTTEYGRLVLFTVGTNTLALFADVVGIYYANAYLLASQEDSIAMRTARGTVLAYGAATGLLIGLVFALPMPRSFLFPGLDGPIWGGLLVSGVLGLALLNQVRGLYLGRRDFLGLGLVGLFQAVLYSVLALATIYGQRWSFSVAVATAQVISILACAALFVALLAARGIGRPSASYLRNCARVGWRAAIINWVSFLHTRIDQYMVNGILGAGALGLYAVAVTLGETLTRIPSMLGFVLFPLVAAEKNRSSAAQTTIRRALITMGAMVVIALPLGLWAAQIIPFMFGEEYLAAIPLFLYLLPAIVFLSGLFLVNNHLAGLGYPLVMLYIMLASITINIVLNWFLLPLIGAVGASIASSISYFIWLMMGMAYLMRQATRVVGTEPMDITNDPMAS